MRQHDRLQCTTRRRITIINNYNWFSIVLRVLHIIEIYVNHYGAINSEVRVWEVEKNERKQDLCRWNDPSYNMRFKRMVGSSNGTSCRGGAGIIDASLCYEEGMENCLQNHSRVRVTDCQSISSPSSNPGVEISFLRSVYLSSLSRKHARENYLASDDNNSVYNVQVI